MARKQQPPAHAGGILDDPSTIIGHEIDEALKDVARTSVGDDLGTRAKELGLEVDRKSLNELSSLLGSRVGSRLQLTEQQKAQVYPLVERHDLIGVHDWVTRNIPNINEITNEEVEAILVRLILQERRKSAIDTNRMGADAPHIIKQPPTAEQLAEAPAHPEPDTTAELKTVASEATHLEGIITDIQERGRPVTAAEAEVAIAGLQDIATRSLIAARQLGLYAVERKLISQNRLGQLLNVSQMTVSRWYREGLDETPHVDRRSLSLDEPK